MASQTVDMSDNVRERVRFGPFVADVHTHELWKEGVRIRLIGQPFEILSVLLSKPGKLVTREELRSRLWPADTFVDFNHGLNAAMNKLREALCDSAENPRYIETLPRRGYRFIANVEQVDSSDNLAPATLRQPSSHRFQTTLADIQLPEPDTTALINNFSSETNVEQSTAFRGYRVWLRVLAFLALGSVLFVFAIWFVTRQSRSPRVARNPVNPPVALTDLADPTSDPAFSPDGTRVAFRRQGYTPANSGIFVKTISNQQVVQLTKTSADCCPAWAPDGKTIAFSRFSNSDHEIYVVGANGGGLRKLYTTSAGPRHGELDWSPDGNYLAFVGESPEGTSSIFLLSKDSTARRITEPTPLNRDWGPTFSPDGQSLAFVRTHETGLPENIMEMPAAGGESRIVVSFYNGILGPPAWTRDGQYIVFASGGGLLRALVFGGDRITRIDEAGSAVMHPATARNGHGLAYQAVSEAFSVWELNLNHGNPISHGLIVSESGRNEGAQISPDGKKIAFMSSRSGNMELWISDRDGSNPYQVTTMNGIGTPHWSPDSRSIAFDVGWRQRGVVFVADVPGGVPRPIAQGDSDNLVPNWSRDGKWIYFASNRTGMWQVWKTPSQGGPAIQVTFHGGFAAYPSIDGQTIYYSKFNLPNPEVWRLPVNGGIETRVPQVRPEDWASWAPVEKGIYFLQKDSADQPNVMFFEFASSEVRRVAVLDKLPFWLSATPDGRSILYEHLDEATSRIMLLKNFQ